MRNCLLGAFGLLVWCTEMSAQSVRDVTVHEGTSMSVAVSPDRRRLAIDLQGSIWTLPVSGGAARRVTDEFNDARQPTWSHDGASIAFMGYRAGGYDIWAVDADGTDLRQLTWGPYDDREPAYSPDGEWLAFSSDRGDSGEYHIWILQLSTGSLRQVTSGSASTYMPSWSPDSRELAYIRTEGASSSIRAVNVTNGADRLLATPEGRADAPSWGPDGRLVYHVSTDGSSAFMSDGDVVTGDENVFAFRSGWVSPTDIVYVSDGLIRRRNVSQGTVNAIAFTASLRVTRPSYVKQRRNPDSRARRPALGIVAPTVSPDGRHVAFVALGDLYLMPVGGTPKNVTRDVFLDAEPAWSPDGKFIAWSTDRGGTLLDIWTYEVATGAVKQITKLANSAMGASWSPDGSRIAFLDVDGVWRRASVSVVDVAAGTVTGVYASSFGPGAPTWSSDGKHIAIAALQPYSSRFREGTNQLLLIPADGSGRAPTWHTPVEHLSIDSRVGAGPAWSPDGTQMALIYEGVLSLLPVSREGTPLGTPRRLTNEMAHAPSWTADGRSILYQSMDRLRMIDVESGDTRDVAVPLSYTPAIPRGTVVVHAAQVFDGVRNALRNNVDIVIVGNRIRQVVPHRAANHRLGELVDAPSGTVMPGLIEFHTHLQKDLGEASMRAYLAFGITSVRSPGSTPYEAVEDREAVDAGVRPGPRLFVTGYLMEWQRVYYKMAVAVSSPAHLELELQRAKALKFDMIKSYVRMPDIQQRRIIEFAHSIGIPAASHEVYPSALSGIDGTEHTTGTSRRGYSPKAATLGRSYGDVAALFAATGSPLTPTLALGGGGMRMLMENDSAFANDPRFDLYPPWLRGTVRRSPATATASSAIPASAVSALGAAGGAMVLQLMRAGTRIVAGTDTPNAGTLHGELYSYVNAGMTPFEALQTATVNSADQLGIPAGRIAPNQLADLIVVDGNPLADIAATARVRTVIANGRVFKAHDLLSPIAK